MGCSLQLIKVMLLTGVLLWLTFLSQLYEKLVHPERKNLSGGGFFLVGLALAFFTVIIYLGFRSRNEKH